MKTLVVGGTGPTGPHVLQGLVARGHDVTIFHRGVHEPPDLPDVAHLHGDPHFAESIAEALGDHEFDTVVAMYGRVRLLAEAFEGRCERFVSIGGTPVYEGFFPRADRSPLPVPITEEHPVVTDESDDPALRFQYRLVEAERAVFGRHPTATILRFPMIYGPNNARSTEWSWVKRIRDGRRHAILPDGGAQVHTRCAARNAAATVLAAVDTPTARGAYNCGDPTSYSLRQWVELIARVMGAELELVSIPSDVAIEASTTLLPLAGTTAPHVVVSTEKARRELGYAPAVDPVDALTELVEWYAAHPEINPATNASFTDRFDYATEDAVIAAYRAAAADVVAAVPQQAAPPIHSMPHPKAPGAVDHRGR